MSKSKFICSVYMGRHGIDVYSESEVVASLLEGDFVPYIPEYCCSLCPSDTGFRLEVDCGLPFSIKPSEDLSTWLVCGEIDALRLGVTLPYLIHYILEVQRMRDCQVTLHGAAVERGGQGLLLLGKQGSGKTSLCLELCRKYGYSLVGNDLVLVGLNERGLVLNGGTKIFRLRLATITCHNTDLRHLFSEKPLADDWTSVAAVKPDAIGASAASGPAQVSQVVLVHLLNNPVEPLYVSKVETIFSRLFLYEEMSRYIRGVCFPMLIGKNLEYGSYLPSLDNVDFHRNRKKLISWIENHSSYRYVSGPMDKICSYLSNGGSV